MSILIPAFNDWHSLARLLPEIDASLGSVGIQGVVTIVDDGSTLPPTPELRARSYLNLQSVDILRLRCNLGHQRAIAVGLAHLTKFGVRASVVAVMDGDGEDRPADIPRLLDEWNRLQGKCAVVFAARRKRFDSLTFRLLYHLYRLVHWMMTGVAVRVGNFSVVSASALPRLTLTPEIWNHYAATVFRSRLSFSTVALSRGRRYQGKSHMPYSALVAHGLSAISVFSDVVGARLLMLFFLVAVGAVLALVAVVSVRLTTTYAIPGWATTATGLLALLAMQAILSLVVLALLVLGDRSSTKIIPLRDAELFVESVDRVFERT